MKILKSGLQRVIKVGWCSMVTIYILLLAAMVNGQERSPHISTNENNTQAQFDKDTAEISGLFEKGGQNQGFGPDSIMPLYRRAYQLAFRHKLEPLMAKSMGLIATSYTMMGDQVRGKQWMDSALHLSAKVNERALTCYIEMLAAIMSQNFSDYRNATRHYFKAIQALENPHPLKSDITPRLYNNFGTMLGSLRGQSNARKYLFKAKDYVLQQKPLDSSFLATILSNIGTTYSDGSLDLAIKYNEAAFEIAKARREPYLLHTMASGLSNFYIYKNDLKKSAYYLEQAAKVSTTGTELGYEEYCRGNLALHLQHYQQAFFHLDTAIKLTEKSTPDYLGSIYSAMAETYAGMGKFDEAYRFKVKGAVFDKEYVQLDKNIITDLLLDYQASANDEVIAHKQLQLNIKDQQIKEKNIWISVIAGGILLLLMLSAIFYRNYKNKQRLEKEQLQNLVQKQEIEKLRAAAEGEEAERARIAHELHDGVMVRFAVVKMKLGMLPAIQQESGGSLYEDIIHQLDIATNELRHTAHNLTPYTILEDGLAQAILYFCKAMEESWGHSVTFLQVGHPVPRFPFETEISIYRIIQELVYNVIKHARATQILAQLNFANHLLSITVEDNGQGFDPKEHAEGFGLRGIRNKVSVLKGNFTIESDKSHGTTIYFELDLNHLSCQDG